MKYYSIVLPMSTATLPIDQLSVVTKTYSWCHTWGSWLRNQIAKKMWQIMEGHYFTLGTTRQICWRSTRHDSGYFEIMKCPQDLSNIQHCSKPQWHEKITTIFKHTADGCEILNHLIYGLSLNIFPITYSVS